MLFSFRHHSLSPLKLSLSLFMQGLGSDAVSAEATLLIMDEKRNQRLFWEEESIPRFYSKNDVFLGLQIFWAFWEISEKFFRSRLNGSVLGPEKFFGSFEKCTPGFKMIFLSPHQPPVCYKKIADPCFQILMALHPINYEGSLKHGLV